LDKELTEKLADLHVLVVDDDGMVRSIMIEYLKHFGIKNIIECKDGAIAMRKVRDGISTRIDIVISDWEMPKINGITLLRAVKGEPGRENTKFIMVTSQASQERFKIARAKALNVDAYIVKPFRGEVLRTKILKVMGWESDDELLCEVDKRDENKKKVS